MKAVEQGVPHEIEARIRRQSDGQYRWHLIRDAGQEHGRPGGEVVGTAVESMIASSQPLRSRSRRAVALYHGSGMRWQLQSLPASGKKRMVRTKF